MKYELPIAEERVKPHQLTALHLFVAFIFLITASLLLLGNAAVSHMPEGKTVKYESLKFFGPSVSYMLYGIAAVILLVSILKNKWLQQPFNNMLFRIIELLIMGALFGYCALTQLTVPTIIYGILSATIILAITWERKKNIPLTVTIDSDGVKPPVTSRIRMLTWAEVEQVILRFGTLTVNCADNRLYQWNVAASDFEHTAFETYCAKQVEEAKVNRKNDW
jgi:hypothetical protein